MADEKLTLDEAKSKAVLWRNLKWGGTAFLAIMAAVWFSFAGHKQAKYEEAVGNLSAAQDSVGGDIVKAAVPAKPAPKALGTPKKPISGSIEKFEHDVLALNGATSVATEHGAFILRYERPCKPGMIDVTGLGASDFDPGHITCGVITDEAANFLTDIGEADYLACALQGVNATTGDALSNAGCASAGFTMGLLATTASPAENSTWATMTGSELVTGTSPGYASWSVARAASISNGWAGTTGATPPIAIANLVDNCSEASGCAQLRTQSNVITGSGHWSVSAGYVYLRGTTNNRLISVAALATGRALENLDTLTVYYKQAMQ